MAMTVKDPAENYSPLDVTLKDGFWFTFEDGEDEVVAHGSAWNGMETVYFNDQVVSQFRHLSSRTSEHLFETEGSAYRLEFYASDVLRGHMRVRLWKNGTLIGEDTKMYIRSFREELWTPKLLGNLWKYLLGGLIVGVLVGIALGFATKP